MVESIHWSAYAKNYVTAADRRELARLIAWSATNGRRSSSAEFPKTEAGIDPKLTARCREIRRQLADPVWSLSRSHQCLQP
jgi:hypothetical protein